MQCNVEHAARNAMQCNAMQAVGWCAKALAARPAEAEPLKLDMRGLGGCAPTACGMPTQVRWNSACWMP